MATRSVARRPAIILALATLLLVALILGVAHFIAKARTRALTGFHDSCVSTAAEAARGRGLDVEGSEIAQKIESYCSCVVGAVESGRLTTAELTAFSADPGAAKVREVIADCFRQETR